MDTTLRDSDASAVLTQTIGELSLASDLDSVTRTVAKAAKALARADGTTFVLRDSGKCFYADEEAISPLWKGQRFPMEACISGWSMLNKQTVTITDIYADPRIPHGAYRPTFVKSLCMVPIRAADPIGAIGNYWKDSFTPTPTQIKLLQVLADSTAVAMENLELKRAIHSSNAQETILRDKNKEIETALYSLAHDLRNPVGAMGGLAEIAMMELPASVSADVKEYLQSICDTALHTNLQIERMLALYQTTSRNINKTEVDLTQLSHGILARLRPQLRGRNLDAEISGNLKVFADPSLIHLVLENLLSNAVKYSGKKPRSVISVGVEPGDGDFKTVYVRDNGEGFEPSQAHKLFRPLSRLHSSDDFKGTGLGLYSASRIIDLHGGRMRAEARPREGAVFYFSLPKAASLPAV